MSDQIQKYGSYRPADRNSPSRAGLRVIDLENSPSQNSSYHSQSGYGGHRYPSRRSSPNFGKNYSPNSGDDENDEALKSNGFSEHVIIGRIEHIALAVVEGSKVVNCRVSVNSWLKKKSQKPVSWYEVSLWDSQANAFVRQDFKIGDQVLFRLDNIRADAWIDRDGQPRASIKGAADKFVDLRPFSLENREEQQGRPAGSQRYGLSGFSEDKGSRSSPAGFRDGPGFDQDAPPPEPDSPGPTGARYIPWDVDDPEEETGPIRPDPGGPEAPGPENNDQGPPTFKPKP
jgi:single-stranded DNA-binding protein